MAIVIGLTGGIAMGKSTISHFLRSKGIAIIDADQIAHTVLDFDEVSKKIAQTFGEKVLNADRKINRRELGSIVFSNPQKLTQLNQIVQPVIRAEILAQIKALSDQKIIILDAPVLFEQGYENTVDFLMVVATNHATQLARLMERDHLNQSEAEKRIKAQIPIEEKIKKASIVVDTSGTIEETQRQVVKWLVNKNLLQNSNEFGEVK